MLQKSLTYAHCLVIEQIARLPAHFHVDLFPVAIAPELLVVEIQTAEEIGSRVSSSTFHLHQQHRERGFHSAQQSVVEPVSM